MLTNPKFRFAVFAAAVLVLPAGLMATGDPRLRDLGKLAMILLPGITGVILSRGLGAREARPAWKWVGLAGVVTLAVALGAVAAAMFCPVDENTKISMKLSTDVVPTVAEIG